MWPVIVFDCLTPFEEVGGQRGRVFVILFQTISLVALLPRIKHQNSRWQNDAFRSEMCNEVVCSVFADIGPKTAEILTLVVIVLFDWDLPALNLDTCLLSPLCFRLLPDLFRCWENLNSYGISGDSIRETEVRRRGDRRLGLR